MTKHLHKYKLKNLSRDPKKPPYWVYICIDQECTHHIQCELTEGKLSACNRCGESFVMRRAKLFTPNQKWMVHPHCDDCTKGRVAKKKKEVKEKLDKKLDSSLDDLLSGILPKGL